MKVLVLGGTGAMGEPLCKYLLARGFETHVTSRREHNSDVIRYHQGSARDKNFFSELLKDNYDTIVDFMSYTTEEFRERAQLLIDNTAQYVFMSSARVYAPIDMALTEGSPRLLDVCDDREYLATDEYALAKAREEDILFQSGINNFTIVRPSLTYNNTRLQYYLGEKEDWLYRYLNKKKIVVPRDCDRIYTTMTYGDDVAFAISRLIGNKKAIGEVVHIAGAKAVTWKTVNDIYSTVLIDKYGRAPEYEYIDDWKDVGKCLGRYYQFKYARSISRVFDNSKLERIIGRTEFIDPYEGLTKCLQRFLECNKSTAITNCRTEAYFDRVTHERTALSKFKGTDRIKYFVGRYTPYFSLNN